MKDSIFQHLLYKNTETPSWEKHFWNIRKNFISNTAHKMIYFFHILKSENNL